MDLDEVMTELTARLDSIAGLRTVDFPPPSITSLVPVGWVRMPESITYDNTNNRHSDVMALTVVVAVGRPSERSTRQRIAKYADGSGPDSVKAALETGQGLGFGGCRVESCEFSIVTVGDIDYAAAEFTVNVHGKGE